VDLPTEVREQIRMWVSLARGNREAQAKEERSGDVEDKFSGLSAVAAVASMSPCVASGESNPQCWALTEARRAEFERMFPSENRASNSRDMSAPKIAALSESVAEAPPDAVSEIDVIAPALAFTSAFEKESALKAEGDRNIEDPFVDAAPTPQGSLQPLPLPLPVLEPGPDRSVPAAFRAEAKDFSSKIRSSRMWPVAALAIVLVVICFALGFAVGPAFLQNWMKAQQPRDLSLEKLSRVKAPAKNADLSDQNASNAVAPLLNVPNTDQDATPELPARTADDHTSGKAAPDDSDRGKNTDEIFDAAAAPSEPASHTRAPNEKPHDAKPTPSEPREMTSEAPTEEAPSSSANAAVNSTATAPAPTKTPSATETPNGSLSAKDSATHATDSSTRQPAASDVPPTAAYAPPAPTSPPVRTPASAAGAANPPQSFFPIVAPTAGSAPRLLELPPERVMDTVTMLIYSRQFVLVPAQPGPESSHKPERVRMGERISNIEPVYPAQAAQKRMGGTVHLRATIGKDGAVESVKAISGPTLLIPSAIDAVDQWRYQPTLLEQQPIEMEEDITIEFRPIR